MIRVPGYDRSAVRPGILNLGLRDFHRVHNAVYFDDLLHLKGHERWGMLSVGMNDSHKKAYQELKVQNSLYSVVSRNPRGESDVRIIGSLLDCLHAPIENRKVIDAIANPEIKIIMLTIKEK